MQKLAILQIPRYMLVITDTVQKDTFSVLLEGERRKLYRHPQVHRVSKKLFASSHYRDITQMYQIVTQRCNY